MQATSIYFVSVRAKAVREAFECYFLQAPEISEIAEAIQAKIDEQIKAAEECDELDADLHVDDARELETFKEAVECCTLLHFHEDNTENNTDIYVARTLVGAIKIQKIAARTRVDDANRRLQELIA
jgi:hypothetical protein